MLKTMCKCEYFDVVSNFIKFFEKKWMDFSTLTFIPQVILADDILFNISLQFQQMALYGGSFVSHPRYGYYTFVLSQSSVHNDIVWTTRTFQDVLANVGGFQSILISIFFVLIGSYQNFSYQRSLLRRFYWQYTNDGKDTERKSDEQEIISRIENRKKLNVRYSHYLIRSFVNSCCCCFKQCCRRGRKKKG